MTVPGVGEEVQDGLDHRKIYRLPGDLQGFRGGLVFKAHRLLYHSTLDSRVILNSRLESRTCRGATFVQRAGVGGQRRWSSNPSGKCSYERVQCVAQCVACAALALVVWQDYLPISLWTTEQGEARVRSDHLLGARRGSPKGGKGLFINSQTRPLHANEENQTTRKGTLSLHRFLLLSLFNSLLPSPG